LVQTAALIARQMEAEPNIKEKYVLWRMKNRHLQLFWQLDRAARAFIEREFASDA
jgi:hypothetical protein